MMVMRMSLGGLILLSGLLAAITAGAKNVPPPTAVLPPVVAASVVAVPIVSKGPTFSLSLSLESITHPLFSASGLRIALSSPLGGLAEIEIARLQLGERTLENLTLRCEDLRWSADRIDCPRGAVQLPSTTIKSSANNKTAPPPLLPIAFSYAPKTQALELNIEPVAGERWNVKTRKENGVQTAEVLLNNARIERIAGLIPVLGDFKPAGPITGKLSWNAASNTKKLVADFRVTGATFGDASGAHAGEKINLGLAASAAQKNNTWAWQADVKLDSGEIFWQPIYIANGPHSLKVSGSSTDSRFNIARGELIFGGIGKLAFSGELDTQTKALLAGKFETSDIDLKQAGPVLLAPFLEQAALPKLELVGQVRAAGTLDGKGEGGLVGLSRLDLTLNELGVKDSRDSKDSIDSQSSKEQRYGLRGLSASIPWRRDEASVATIRVAGANLGKLPIPSFTLPLKMKGLSFELPHVEIPILDGKLVLDNLQIKKAANTKAADTKGGAMKDGEWQWQLGGALQPVSMLLLSETFKLPRMTGSLSASIPKIQQSGSTVVMDGALIIQVFDGFVSATNLKVVEPFGRVPRLYADLEMRHFDLGMLTETFSFGGITGFIDGDVKGLELASWQPQRFDAKIISSEGDYRKRISQRAVENMSSLGGAGATAAIQRSVLRFFDEFGYSKIGLTCVLVDGACEMGGAESAPNGYYIVKGGGVPAINVIGYNRRVDWDELVTRLKRVTEGNGKPIIQ